MLKHSAASLITSAVLCSSLLAGFDFPRGQKHCAVPADAKLSFQEIARFDVPNANQGVGVDEDFFYAIDNSVITKHEKRSGKEVARWSWQGAANKNPVLHLDGATIVDGKLYAAHSNYPEWPMTSSVEIWDTRTMKHIGTHSFGIMWGSLTWIDWHDGAWWGTFANYNVAKPHPDPADPNGYDVLPGNEAQRVFTTEPYGYKRNTTMVKFTRDFQPLQSWVLPDEILTPLHTGDMSNSGGSWGPDGFLYLSGHDLSEVYKVSLPEAGSKLVLHEIIALGSGQDVSDISKVGIRGQGIAWDRSQCGVLYGVIRATSAERKQGITHKVTASKLVY